MQNEYDVCRARVRDFIIICENNILKEIVYYNNIKTHDVNGAIF